MWDMVYRVILHVLDPLAGPQVLLFKRKNAMSLCPHGLRTCCSTVLLDGPGWRKTGAQSTQKIVNTTFPMLCANRRPCYLTISILSLPSLTLDHHVTYETTGSSPDWVCCTCCTAMATVGWNLQSERWSTSLDFFRPEVIITKHVTHNSLAGSLELGLDVIPSMRA
jgi:hypothetical protein